MEHRLTAGVRNVDALLSVVGKGGKLGNRRQPLAEGGPGLLDLPLGVKIPVHAGSKPVFCRTKLGEKLHQPSGYFNLGDPYCRLLSTDYNSLHDPHLRAYHKRKDNLQRLKREGYVTSDSRVGLGIGLIKTVLLKRGSQSACCSRLLLAEGTGLWGCFPWEQK
ncbi:fibrous sheath-interacting protein 2-like [Accipiter gentilis]|uniref:fibrous sheath-interacting protein 2-like n=1 Tax=Astur gentilis TaxID=8957 RepID=UPI00210F8C33|nr:fibrous sheath-interacting protein 2-like [Accipiter gentilis]